MAHPSTSSSSTSQAPSTKLLLRFLLTATLALTACARPSTVTKVASDMVAGRPTSPSLVNGTLPWGDDPKELVKRNGQKYVFMHHIVGNTYPYTTTDWENDIREIAAKGIDAIALNIGSSSWQRTQVASAYAAAQRLNSPLKLFYSFDFTEMPCDLEDFVARVNLYANHPNQFKVNGKTFISSYGGDCLGNGGWQSLKDRTNGYVMPFIWGLEGRFGQWGGLDSWYCWGCAYPQGNHDKTTDDDRYYMNQLGSKYATTVSGWMFTHLSYKSFYQRGDNWLLNTRWEQLMNMRNELTFVEMITWNDYGESNYFGPIRGAQPAGTYWADDYPHTAWFDMSEYYIRGFKTGSYPVIQQDVIYYWSKPHPAWAVASNDPIGRRPDGFDWSEDFLWATVFAVSPAQVTLRMGSSTQTFSVPAGVTKLKLPSSPGRITVSMVRGGATVVSETPGDFEYVNTPQRYNYNVYVGAASGIQPDPTGTSTSTSTSTSTTTSTTSTTTSTTSMTSTTTSTTTTTTTTSTPTTTSVAGSTWTYNGCYDDPTNDRILFDGVFTSTTQNTISSCLSTCVEAGYAFGGVEYGRECFCGTHLRAGAVLRPNAECNMDCAGNAAEKCGAGNRLGVYSRTPSTTTTTTSTTATPTPTTTSVAGSTWTYRGCYPDDINWRTVYDGGMTSELTNTVSRCLTTCANRGFAFGGVEYGRECFCGTQIRSGVARVPDGQCNQACSGDANEMCGAGGRIGIYERPLPTTTSDTGPTATPTATVTVTAFGHRGCIAEGTTGTRRALIGASYHSRHDLTPQWCHAQCANFQFAGVENGNECFCGNTVQNNGATGTVIPADRCANPCTGDASQACGGGWTVDLYQKTTASYNAVGCYVDSSERMLRGYVTERGDMTTERCVGTCLERGFRYAATQNGGQCFCGNEIVRTGSAGGLTAAGECSTTCRGNSAQICGAGWRNTLYVRA